MDASLVVCPLPVVEEFSLQVILRVERVNLSADSKSRARKKTKCCSDHVPSDVKEGTEAG